MIYTRRSFLTLAAGIIAAPAIVKATSIMPVKTIAEFHTLTEEQVRLIHHDGYAWRITANEARALLYDEPMPSITFSKVRLAT